MADLYPDDRGGSEYSQGDEPEDDNQYWNDADPDENQDDDENNDTEPADAEGDADPADDTAQDAAAPAQLPVTGPRLSSVPAERAAQLRELLGEEGAALVNQYVQETVAASLSQNNARSFHLGADAVQYPDWHAKYGVAAQRAMAELPPDVAARPESVELVRYSLIAEDAKKIGLAAAYRKHADLIEGQGKRATNDAPARREEPQTRRPMPPADRTPRGSTGVAPRAVKTGAGSAARGRSTPIADLTDMYPGITQEQAAAAWRSGRK